MNDKALSQAKSRVQAAKKKLEDMLLSGSPNDTCALWSEFLTEHNKAYQKLYRATETGKSKIWADKLKNTRKCDELLRYIHHARNADEHGIEDITASDPSVLTIGDPGEDVHIEYLNINGPNVSGKVHHGTVRWYPPRVRLIPVKDRGEIYDLPHVHLGEEISPDSPFRLGELACKYLESVIREAEVKFGGRV